MRWIQNWPLRHQDRTNFYLHMLGIPATIVAVPLAILGRWPWAVGLFLGGYGLQYIGHVIEGNRSGEEELLRRIFRRRGGKTR